MNSYSYNPKMTDIEKSIYREINKILERKSYKGRYKICKSRGLDELRCRGRFYTADFILMMVLDINVDLESYLQKLKNNGL